MKRLFTVLTLILLWGNSFGQTTASVNSNLMESHGIMSFKPMDIMATPQTLMKVWIDEPIPVNFYSDKEKEVQKLINEKTTDGIITYSPLDKEKEWTSVDYEEITPFTWKWVDFELPKPDGTITKINLLRPHWWIQKLKADSVGKWVYLNMPELGSKGWATITAIRINQLDTRFWDESRDGDYVSRPITGKFTHESNDVYNLHFGDNAKPLGVTGSHPIWSIDRNNWVGAVDLKIGETVKTQDGEVILKSREKVNGRHKVYNLEIYRDHNFLVSNDKILVHNTCFPFKSLQGKNINWINKQKPKGWKTVQKDNGKGWKWLDENGNERLIYQRPSGKNATNSQWSRMENGYFRRRNADGDYLDIDGNVVPKTDPDFQWKTHIAYEGIH